MIIWNSLKLFPHIHVYLFIFANTERNWAFVTNSDFLIPISLQPNVVDLRYFKLWNILKQIIWVWHIKGLHYQVAKIVRTRKFEFVTKTLISFWISSSCGMYLCIYVYTWIMLMYICIMYMYMYMYNVQW